MEPKPKVPVQFRDYLFPFEESPSTTPNDSEPGEYVRKMFLDSLSRPPAPPDPTLTFRIFAKEHMFAPGDPRWAEEQVQKAPTGFAATLAKRFSTKKPSTDRPRHADCDHIDKTVYASGRQIWAELDKDNHVLLIYEMA